MRILIANAIATIAHWGQRREITGEPYVRHPRRVAARVKEVGGDSGMQAAALLHDVLEDTRFPRGLILLLMGNRITFMVDDLTDEYTHEAYPNLNRARRKRREAARLSKVCPESRLIKLLDLEDNLASYATPEGYAVVKGFIRRFGKEAQHLSRLLAGGSMQSQQLAAKVHTMAQRGIEIVEGNYGKANQH